MHHLHGGKVGAATGFGEQGAGFRGVETIGHSNAVGIRVPQLVGGFLLPVPALSRVNPLPQGLVQYLWERVHPRKGQ
ncbi:hypothetical protein PPUN109347_19830 [Pseudomonas putida]|nr:hypothetical protein PPUN109347_19130 [Pseudomonas putida]GLO45420.1 hypothetical protein PPUN109347_19830 [Pseudomonas putida]